MATMTYDVVCIGFGTRGLALSTILADHDSSQKVLVVERNDRFDVNLSSAFPDHGMASTFLRDLITLRNPRSPYTFINFLHDTNLLIDFTNVSQLSTTRRLAMQYMTWVADKIQDLGWIQYGKEVVNITPSRSTSDGQITRWNVDLRARENGAASKVSCKKIVIATSPTSQLPESLSSPRVAPYTIPLERTAEVIDRFATAKEPLNVAILGADQEAVELFEHIVGLPGQHRATLVFEGTALRAVDSTPFAQELIDGARLSNLSLHHLPPELRQKLVATSVSAAFPTIDLHLLERLYGALYTQRLSQSDSIPARFSIRPQTRVVNAQIENDKVQLTCCSLPLPAAPASAAVDRESETYDLVVTATQRSSLPGASLLAPLFRALDAQSSRTSSRSSPSTPSLSSSTWSVDGDYKLNFRRKLVAPGCGIWVLGTLAGLHARRTDLSILSASAGRAVDGMLAEAKKEGSKEDETHNRGQVALL